jgi:1-acyl-sn-glycerol-3-phosphate acyltransferase
MIVWWGFVLWIIRILLFVFYRLRKSGQQHIPRTGSVLFVANHQSNLDPAIVGAIAVDRPFKGIARETLFHSKLLSAFMKGFGAISIKRGESDTVAIRAAIAELAYGRCALMFPEGTRTTDGEVGKFQRGFWLLMKKSNAIVQPIGIDGAFDACPTGSKPKLRGYIEVEAGEPIDAAVLLEMGEEQGTAFVRSAIETLMLQCREKIKKRSK